jgi:hypothetical protein
MRERVVHQALNRHPLDGQPDGARRREQRVVLNFAQSEVADFRRLLVVDENVTSGQVAMDTLFVRQIHLQTFGVAVLGIPAAELMPYHSVADLPCER